MLELYLRLEQLWFTVPEKMRFLLIGGYNTVLSYLIFLLFFELFNLNYNLALILQYLISVNISILTMRYYVFRSRKNFTAEYFKAWGTYLLMLLLNFIWLNVFALYFNIYPAYAQFIYIFVSTVLTYLSHKHFSFRN